MTIKHFDKCFNENVIHRRATTAKIKNTALKAHEMGVVGSKWWIIQWISVELGSTRSVSLIKCQFKFVKARYKGLAKNDNQLAMLFTLANIVRLDQMIRWQPKSA